MGKNTQLSSALYITPYIAAWYSLFIVMENIGVLNWRSSSNVEQTVAIGLSLLVLLSEPVTRDTYSNTVTSTV